MTDDNTAPFATHTDVATAHASKYLQQMCKHFGHKVEASCDADSGVIRFPAGECRMTANATTLTMRLAAVDAEVRERLKDVLDSHLARFAFREQLQITWSDG